MAWFKKERKPRPSVRERLEIPPDAWEKCGQCGHVDIREKFEQALSVCPECGWHRRFSAEEYIELLTDSGSWRELYADLANTRGVRLVGIDTPSIDPHLDLALECNREAARLGMANLEGVVLRHVQPGFYTLVAMPLRLAGPEASPVRAVLVAATTDFPG